MQKIALVLAIAAVGEGLIALHLVRQLHEEREQAQALQARVAELEHASTQRAAGATFVAVPTSPASPFSSGGPNASVQQPLPSVRAVTVPNAFLGSNAALPDQVKLRERMNAAVERQRTLLRDPEYRDAMLSQQKMMLARANPDLAKDLNLTADQADRLFSTLAEQAVRGMDNVSMWEEQSDPARAQELQRKAIEQQDANQAELKSVLGEAKYREWQEYQAQAPVRWEATRLRTSLADAGVPLDDSLTKPLIKILQDQQKLEMQRLDQYPARGGIAANQGYFVSSGSGATNVVQLMTNSVDSLAKTQQRQRDALASVLSPEQIRIVEEQHNAELQMQRAQERLMRAQQEAGGLDPTQVAPAVSYAVEQGVTVVPATN
jgi:hypothetical protein